MKNIFAKLSLFVAAAVMAAALSATIFAQASTAEPPKPIIFAVMGDTGSGDDAQRAVAQQMVKQRQQKPFEFVIMIVVTTKITKKDSATGWTADRKITGIVESATRTIPAITEKEIRLTAKAFAKATLRVIRDTTAGEGGNEEGKQCGQPFGMSALRQKPQAEKSAAFLRSTWPLIF